MLDLLDAAIDEIKQHRQSLGDLLQFLRDARKGVLTEQEVAQEAQMWHQLVEVGWQAVPAGSTVERAVTVLAQQTATGSGSGGGAGAAPGPAHPLGEALAPLPLPALGTGAPAGLPALRSPAGAATATAAEDAESEAESLPATAMAMASATPTDAATHGTAPGPVHGAAAELPHPGSVELATPGPEDDERAVLLTAATATVPGCTEVVWSRLRPRTAPPPAPWGDVLVVAADDPEHQAAVVQELTEALPASVFPEALVVGRRADLVHPLVELVVATGRVVSAL
jgi:hypothetical protein